MHGKTLILAAAAMLVGPPALASTAALPAAADVTLIDNPTGEVANGAGPQMRAGQNGLGWKLRAAIRFDVSAAVPAGATVDDVTLILHNSVPDVDPNNLPRRIGLHRLLASWGEGGSFTGGGQGAPAAPGDATWRYRFYNPADPDSAPAWDAFGGDFAVESSTSTDVAGSGYYSWSAPGMVEDVQLWLVRPEWNHGWLLIGDESALNSAKKLETREAEDPALRPLLLIEYSTGVPGDDEGDDHPQGRGH